jgi:ribosomal protein S2
MYLNKLFILKKLQQVNAHLGLPVAAKNSKWSRFSAHRAQSSIFGLRGGQTIINLDDTLISLRRACNVIQLIIQSNGHFLFVNTNPKYNKIIQQTAKYTNQSFINHKWIGGFLTNWNHMQSVQKQFYEAANWASGAKQDTLSTPQRMDVSIESSYALSSRCGPRYKKMQKCFEGTLRPQTQELPDCVIVFNANQNSAAIYEAHLNQIPIIALIDSNIPNDLYNLITYPIPANYESVQFIYLFCNCIIKTICRKTRRASVF